MRVRIENVDLESGLPIEIAEAIKKTAVLEEKVRTLESEKEALNEKLKALEGRTTAILRVEDEVNGLYQKIAALEEENEELRGILEKLIERSPTSSQTQK
ncbi:MAG: hypothetical protein NZ920_01275 [Aigarchaeota archaeon]|nr:hypothetical protein [Aigarchaeota archaeon]MDW8093073.1 hypothetical protein [Nitrososphaerota archaeon]